jgi:hypothetical protein
VFKHYLLLQIDLIKAPTICKVFFVGFLPTTEGLLRSQQKLVSQEMQECSKDLFERTLSVSNE